MANRSKPSHRHTCITKRLEQWNRLENLALEKRRCLLLVVQQLAEEKLGSLCLARSRLSADENDLALAIGHEMLVRALRNSVHVWRGRYGAPRLMSTAVGTQQARRRMLFEWFVRMDARKGKSQLKS